MSDVINGVLRDDLKSLLVAIEGTMWADAQWVARCRALLTAQPQASDSWPKLEKPARVGSGVFAAGLSARLVVEAAYRQHQYAEEPPFSDEQIKAMTATLCQPQASAAQSAPAGEREDEREAFEAVVRLNWASAPLHYVRDALPKDDPRYGQYVDETLQGMWVGWQGRASWQRTQSAGVPEGWRLVPVEPTDEMLAATTTSKHPALRAEVMRMAREDYRAMLAAAPAQPAAQDQGEVQRLREAVSEFLDARQALIDFERENPNGSTKRLDACLYRVEEAEDAMHAALAASTGQEV